MLNFGYWKDAGEPVAAQKALCTLVGEEAELGLAKKLLDVGSGLAAPAAHWKSRYDLDVSCVNINYRQLAASRQAGASLVNATSTLLPFSDSSMDRIIALESAQQGRTVAVPAAQLGVEVGEAGGRPDRDPDDRRERRGDKGAEPRDRGEREGRAHGVWMPDCTAGKRHTSAIVSTRPSLAHRLLDVRLQRAGSLRRMETSST